MLANRYEDDDNFEEEGCTFEFFDETEGVAGRNDAAGGGAVYREYEGEDFGQYLDDDDDDTPHEAAMYPGPQLDGGGGGADGSRRRKSATLLRETFGRLLLTVGGGSGGGPGGRTKAAAVQAQNPPGYRIQDVSFADCKMGGGGSDSGIDSRSGYSMETDSDLGPTYHRAPSSLASSSSSGVPNNDNTVRRQQQQQQQHHHQQQQQRQHHQKSSDADRASSDGVKRLSNPFRKIYKTLNRRKSTNLQEMSYNQDYEDIRL